MHQERFDKVVHALLSPELEGGISKSMTRKLVMVGATYLNGSRCRIASKPVYSGNEIRVEYDPRKFRTLPVNTVRLAPEHILFNEAGLIVVNKPANLPTVPTLDNARDDLISALHGLLGKEQYIGIHHRLDAPTSGCVLFTTKEDMNTFAAGLFQENLIQKKYLAVVTLRNPPGEKKWEIKNQLARAEKKKNIYASVKTEGPALSVVEGSFAHSRFELLQAEADMGLIACEPVTGRTHQLRVHLSESGMPILGDRTYQGKEYSRLMLHAWKLTFRHPTENREVTVEAPAPEEFKKLFDL